MVGFYRVESYESPQQARALSEEWRGILLLPIVDPSSAGGRWLSSPEGRRTLAFKTGTEILIIYPDQESDIDYIQWSEGLCEAFLEHGHDLRCIYPEPAVLIIEEGLKKCTVVRLRPPKSLPNMKGPDIIRRGMIRIIDSLVNGAGTSAILKAEADFYNLVIQISNAAPLLSSFARKISMFKIWSLFRRLGATP